MKIIFFSILLLSSLSYAFDVKPGLWDMQNTVEIDGKKYDPQAEIKKALAQVPEAQRAQMMQMLKGAQSEHGFSFVNLDTSKVCIKNEDILNGKLFEKDENCKFNLKINTAKKITGSFTCKDGAKGDVDWNAVNPKKYTGIIHATDEKGKRAKVEIAANFVTEKCN